MGIKKVDREEYVKEIEKYAEQLESALFDVLDGNSSWGDIKCNTGLSDARCKEIESFFTTIVTPVALLKKAINTAQKRKTNV